MVVNSNGEILAKRDYQALNLAIAISIQQK